MTCSYGRNQLDFFFSFSEVFGFSQKGGGRKEGGRKEGGRKDAGVQLSFILCRGDCRAGADRFLGHRRHPRAQQQPGAAHRYRAGHGMKSCPSPHLNPSFSPPGPDSRSPTAPFPAPLSCLALTAAPSASLEMGQEWLEWDNGTARVGAARGGWGSSTPAQEPGVILVLLGRQDESCGGHEGLMAPR